MFVPLAVITIHKKTDSVTHDAPYTLPIYKLLWHGKGAERISMVAVKDPACDPMREIVAHNGKEPVEVEEERLMKKFGKKLFFTVFPGDSFRGVFEKTATKDNPWKTKHDAQRVRDLKRAKNEARGVIMLDPAEATT